MPTKSQEILLETHRIGNAVKVTAVDAVTGTEISFQVPASASPLSIKRLAINKMEYVMRSKDKGKN